MCQHQKKRKREINGVLGQIDVDKNEFKAAIKDGREKTANEFVFTSNKEGKSALISTTTYYGKWIAVYLA